MRIGSHNVFIPSKEPDHSTSTRAAAASSSTNSVQNSSSPSPADLAAQEARPVQGVAAIANDKLKKTDLSPGDILILLDQPDNTCFTHKIIKTGQLLPSLSALRTNKGDPALVHSLIWSKTQKNPDKLEANGKGEPEIVQMRGGNQQSSLSGPVQKGLYKVYSPKDKNLGDWAAQIGQMWSADKKVPYSKLKCVLSVVRNSGFKSGGKAASEKYGAQAFENSPRIRGAFCSHFVLAAYQAAAKKIGIPISGALKVDAEATSVRTLEHYLKKDDQGFDFKGYLKIEPEDVLYQE
ncbi:HopBD2 [Pseudomonas syringae pv. spinaceae]|uniref:HopBD2 n=1 Tax=Pseudomonas syringae pv. spinaceae TaxID=264459 RepID=A0A0Q0AFD2_PSESX|nr:hypothetical protein [Pseudomonas syringae]KPY73084.1 HopBD2 [Pseudomonas syringae pv. spinaceae]RMT36136.1 HopBD2 [Pseudomonas syringae pv. spinaceae]